jgi:hypothetical protein
MAPTTAERADPIARAALAAMLTRPFRVGPLPPADVQAQLLERVRHCVRRGRPIQVTVGYGPLKNQNAVAYSRADWAEYFALCHLVAWHNKVQAIYPPGLSLSIAFDDATIAMANHADEGLMRSYMTSIADLIRALGFERVLTASMRQSFFAWLFHFGVYQLAGLRVGRWERDPANREQLERMNRCAARNVTAPAGLAPAERDAYVRAASHRYRVCWQALQLSGLTTRKSRLFALYLDGSQHHIRQAVAFHLTSLDKGQVTQPWQGAGTLLDNGHGGLEPFVLTAGRRPQYATRIVEGLDVLPLPGFDRVAVAEPLGRAAADSAPQSRPAPAPQPTS